MDPTVSTLYQQLMEGLTRLFKELAVLERERERLLQENSALREEAARLRHYIETQFHGHRPEGRPARGGREASETPETASELSDAARAFYEVLPATLSFAALVELAAAQGVGRDRLKGYVATYLRAGLMHRQGNWLEKTPADNHA